MAHELIGFYTIADNTDNILKVMRSYQYYAIIQSFSRTNRLFNNLEKPFGTIKYYRYPFTMKNNIESAVKNYSGDNPFGVFVSSLDTQLKGMNHEYDEIRSVFMAADIPDYSRLPDEAVDKRKFSDLFKRFSTYLAAAKIQDFTWKKNTYIFEDDCEIEYIIKVEIEEETYLVLLQRYKELSGAAGPGGGADAPYDIDTNITESDLPYITQEKAEEITRKFRPTVNVWMIIGIIIILDLAYCAHNWVLNSLDLGRRKRRWK